MNENIRFIEVLDCLKKKGLIDDYVSAASTLGTNKAAISDLKSGRKKLSIEILRRMKISYPVVNMEYIIMGAGDMFNEGKENCSIPINSNQDAFIEKIAQQAEEIGILKERIKQLERVKDTSAWDAPTATRADVG